MYTAAHCACGVVFDFAAFQDNGASCADRNAAAAAFCLVAFDDSPFYGKQGGGRCRSNGVHAAACGVRVIDCFVVFDFRSVKYHLRAIPRIDAAALRVGTGIQVSSGQGQVGAQVHGVEVNIEYPL